MPPFEFQFVDFKTIEGELAIQLNRYWNDVRHEHLPDDPPTPLEEHLGGWHNLPDTEEDLLWVLQNDDQSAIIATCEVELELTEDNQHMLYFEANVAAPYRRQGIGRAMLRLATEIARERGKRLMLTETSEAIPAGAAFAERAGFKPGLAERVSVLRIAEFDRSILADWQENKNGRYDPYELGLWVGPYPEEHIQEAVELFQIANDEPRDDLEIEDRQYTAEMLREWEAYRAARGSERWSMHVKEKATGRVCGFTEVYWNPNNPTFLQQAFTGVHPDFRGKGLGRWLKAAMMEKVLRDRPQVELIRTGNAYSNRFMLAINDEMGFKPYMAWTVWQADTATVWAYLNS